jgi:hypothetical protein
MPGGLFVCLCFQPTDGGSGCASFLLTNVTNALVILAGIFHKNKKMVYFKAYNSCVIPAPIEDVWPVIRDFAAFLDWHPSFDGTCEIKDGNNPAKVGAIRTIKTKDGGVFVESLYELSDRTHIMTYFILESPLPMKNYAGIVSCTKITDSNQTFLSWEAEAEVESQEHFDIIAKVAKEAVCDPGLAALKEKFA